MLKRKNKASDEKNTYKHHGCQYEKKIDMESEGGKREVIGVISERGKR